MVIQKSEIKFDADGKSITAYLASPSQGGPGLLVLPSWWGLKPFFKEVCDQMAEHGYTALAPDYYGGRIGHTIEETQALQQEAEGDIEAMSALIKGAKDRLVSLRMERPIGIVGFSMGTDWAVMTAGKAPDVSATVLFYGCYSVDFSKMKSKVLGHFAEHDEWVDFETVKVIEGKMKAAGVQVTLHRYPGTAHWFVEADRPEYNPAAANLAWDRTFDFLKENLG